MGLGILGFWVQLYVGMVVGEVHRRSVGGMVHSPQLLTSSSMLASAREQALSGRKKHECAPPPCRTQPTPQSRSMPPTERGPGEGPEEREGGGKCVGG